MKGEPFTLLGRTAVALGALTLVSLVLWTGITVVFLIVPIRKVQLNNIHAVVILARELVSAQPEKDRIQLLENYRIVSDLEPKPALGIETYGYVPDLQVLLQKSMGHETIVYRDYDKNTLWIRFVANNRNYWVIIPKWLPPLPSYILATIFIVIAVSILGAYFIIYSTTKELRKVTSAVRAFGQGASEPVLEETGPREIRDLSRGFNQMAADLRKLEDDRRLMLAGISHDLKTPLSQLRIGVELVEPHTEPEITEGMVHDIEDMGTILKQFLDYARDGSEEPIARHDLNELVREICARYDARGIRIETKLAMLPSFCFRRLAITRAVTNVIDNAVRYGRVGIEVTTRMEGKRVEIEVADQGPGIKTNKPSDYIKAFARENSARSEAGSGLGLTIVDRIMRGHAGELSVENRQPTGLLVKMQLPIVEA